MVLTPGPDPPPRKRVREIWDFRFYLRPTSIVGCGGLCRTPGMHQCICAPPMHLNMTYLPGTVRPHGLVVLLSHVSSFLTLIPTPKKGKQKRELILFDSPLPVTSRGLHRSCQNQPSLPGNSLWRSHFLFHYYDPSGLFPSLL